MYLTKIGRKMGRRHGTVITRVGVRRSMGTRIQQLLRRRKTKIDI